jgi:hypothetical protein
MEFRSTDRKRTGCYFMAGTNTMSPESCLEDRMLRRGVNSRHKRRPCQSKNPSTFKSYTVILPKKSELSSNTSLILSTPFSTKPCATPSGLSSKLCCRLTSSGYMCVRVCHSVLSPAFLFARTLTEHRVPTKPPWKVRTIRLGTTGDGKPNWTYCGIP